MDRRCSPQYPRVERGLTRSKEPRHASPVKDTVAVLGIDIGKNSFHLVGLNKRGAIILRLKLSRTQLEAKLANLPPCLVGMEACVGAHHLSRRLKALGHDPRLIPARYARAFLKGNKNDFRDAEAIAEAVQRPTMRFVATKTAEQLDLQALRVRSRLVSERTATVNEIRAFLLDRGLAVAKVYTGCGPHCRASSPPAPTCCRRACCTSSRTWLPTGVASMSASTLSRSRSRRWQTSMPAASD
jgi:transposase